MTLDELIAKLEQLAAAVPALVLKHTEVAALDALASVDLRISEKGITAMGNKFEDYTPQYKRRKAGVTLRKPGRTQASIELARARGGSGLAKGKYRGFVDFTLSGQMLASTTTGFENIAPTEKSVSGTTARIRFDGRDELTKKKLEGNNRKRKGFMDPSKAEIDAAAGDAREGMERDIQEILR